MARKGRCRCGQMLRFEKGPQGYKMRCPGCSSVVRLRVDGGKRPQRPATLQCPCGAVLVIGGAKSATCPCCRKTLLVPIEPKHARE